MIKQLYINQELLSINHYIYGSASSASRITNTGYFPYNATCRTVGIKSNGENSIGSAALVGPRLALTSAHCVFEEDKFETLSDGTKMKYKLRGWTCYPGYNNGAVQGGKSCGWSRVFYSSKWMSTTSKSTMYKYDWAICVLEQPLGDYVTYFGCQSYGSNSEMNNLQIKLTGYPGDTSYGYRNGAPEQYETGEKISNTYNEYFTFLGYTVRRI